MRFRGEPPRRQSGSQATQSAWTTSSRIRGEPTGAANPELLKMHPSHGHDRRIVNGISRIGYMTGGKSARWVDEDMADTITGKAVQFIEQQSDAPVLPLFRHARYPRAARAARAFRGQDRTAARAATRSRSWTGRVGQILDTLDRLKLTRRHTLHLLQRQRSGGRRRVSRPGGRETGDHKPAGPLRGGKYSAYDGGTRVPFVVRWPGAVKAGVSAAPFSQVDLLASFAALADRKLPRRCRARQLQPAAGAAGQIPAGPAAHRGTCYRAVADLRATGR